MRWRGHAGDIGKSGNADGCRRTEADGEGMAGGAAGGSWLYNVPISVDTLESGGPSF